MEQKIQVYMIYGFLESGKTQFIDFTTSQDYFKQDEPTLIIQCEEGMEEYDVDKYRSHDAAAQRKASPETNRHRHASAGDCRPYYDLYESSVP